MADMTQTIIPKSDQLNADDLLTGPRTITITKTVIKDSKEQPVDVFFEGDNNKPYRPGLSMRRVMVDLWGPDQEQYTGRSMTLYCDPSIKFGKDKVGGIRISHMSHLDQTMKIMLTTTRARRSEFTVLPLPVNDAESAINKARVAAGKGTEEFRKYYNTDFAKQYRDEINAHLDEFKKIAADVDDEAKPLSQKLAEQSSPPDEQQPEEGKTDGDEASTTSPSATPGHWTDDINVGDGIPGSDAWDAGMEAFKQSAPFTDNPYENDMEAAQDWAGGYIGAQRTAE